MTWKSKEVFAQSCSQTSVAEPPQGWDYAIAVAKRQIEEAQTKIEHLGHSIKTFEEMRDSGEPWPGTVETPAQSGTQPTGS